LKSDKLGIIAGNGLYPIAMARAARAAGVSSIVAAAFENETDPKLAELVDDIEWMRVGQLTRLISFFSKRDVHRAVMAGQIAPQNLFQLRPDIKALILLGKLKRRNAETIFGAIADELARANVTLLSATTYMEDYLAQPGQLAGPRLSVRQEEDVTFGFSIAKEIARLDIGQTVVVKNGTVIAVEAFEGTNETIRRGGSLARKGAVMVKVSKPRQDFRFDVPVIGSVTLQHAHDARLSAIAVEAGRTLLLDREALIKLSERHRIALVARSV
jgi:UDP-2,3-diacylglucosamine hydrolase